MKRIYLDKSEGGRRVKWGRWKGISYSLGGRRLRWQVFYSTRETCFPYLLLSPLAHLLKWVSKSQLKLGNIKEVGFRSIIWIKKCGMKGRKVVDVWCRSWGRWLAKTKTFYCEIIFWRVLKLFFTILVS